ncbi:MAG TPA: ATP-binding protein [Terriglobia bacterium]|nr:ATP-binding protein [Terriglobia bacterium]
MNPRSIRFRLAAYHVLLLAGVLLAFSLAAFWGFRRHLTDLVEAQSANLTRQIAESLLANVQVSGVDYLRDEVQEHYDPETNNLFVRIVQSDGALVYESGEPHDRSFSPPQLGFLADLKNTRSEVDTTNQRLIFIRPYSLPSGEHYQIQMVASLRPVQTSLAGLSRVESFLFPFALLISACGSAFLISRSLNPIRQVIATAQKINSSNLRQRLAEASSGDEIQKLTQTLNQMLERLEASFKQMIQFTADASHELRTPLTVIRGNLELALRHNGNHDSCERTAEIQEILAQSLEEAERLSGTVGQLMELTQLDSGEIQLEKEVFDLTELVAMTVEQMKLLAEDKQIHLETQLSPAIKVQGDRYRLKQVLLNLIDNAIKYCPTSTRIQIRLAQTDSSCVLEVKDNGPGIPKSDIQRLFDRFYRIDKARSREIGGSGLGLSICRSICEGHGGRIEAESEVGRGSTFRVTLPSQAESQSERTLT